MMLLIFESLNLAKGNVVNSCFSSNIFMKYFYACRAAEVLQILDDFMSCRDTVEGGARRKDGYSSPPRWKCLYVATVAARGTKVQIAALLQVNKKLSKRLDPLQHGGSRSSSWGARALLMRGPTGMAGVLRCSCFVSGRCLSTAVITEPVHIVTAAQCWENIPIDAIHPKKMPFSFHARHAISMIGFLTDFSFKGATQLCVAGLDSFTSWQGVMRFGAMKPIASTQHLVLVANLWVLSFAGIVNKTVASSTVEAEYLAVCCKVLVVQWFRTLFKALKLFVDSRALSCLVSPYQEFNIYLLSRCSSTALSSMDSCLASMTDHELRSSCLGISWTAPPAAAGKMLPRASSVLSLYNTCLTSCSITRNLFKTVAQLAEVALPQHDAGLPSQELAEKCVSNKGDIAMCIKCAITAKRKALKMISSHCL
ncbi:hypothetical protein PR048_013906 [Dryococelus australis]|uniref:Uncharacterized protein n=1 Tax=Dryococelus australis TaxID=614101 RepID=A0ABQ9HTH9_9NEOP|nr:hypothetical protein PR048_013906 [Dryococelus australis]